MGKCWYCNQEVTFGNDKEHEICEEKMEKLYAISKMLENKIITKSEYCLMLADITGKIYRWNDSK